MNPTLASNAALEDVVREQDDEASWAVLEDWLLETGDPRARIVRLEKAGAGTTSAMNELAPLLFGSEALAKRVVVHASRAGFVRAATLKLDTIATAKSLANAPGLALLRDAELRLKTAAHLAVPAFRARAAGIARLTLELAYPAGGFDASFLSPFERLEHLRVTGRVPGVANISKTLRSLDLALPPESVGSIIRTNRLDGLHALTIATGTLLYPWQGVFDRLFEGACAPKLRELHLDAAPTSGNFDFLRDLAQSALGKRLARLSLAGTECSPPALRRLGRAVSSLADVAL